MKYMLKVALLFIFSQTPSMAQPDLSKDYYVVSGQIIKRDGTKHQQYKTHLQQRKKNVSPQTLPLKAVDISKTIFVGQKQAITLDFSQDNSPYTGAVSFDACPCLLIGIKTQKKGGLIHLDETTQVESIATYLKADFAGQGKIDIYINGINNLDVNRLLDDRTTTQKMRIDDLKEGILTSCKNLKINIIDNTGDQDINTRTNELNTLGVAKEGFFNCFFYNDGLYYKQTKGALKLRSEEEQAKVKEFLSIYYTGGRETKLYVNYIKTEAPQRFGIPYDFNNQSKKIPIDLINLKKLIGDNKNPFPNLYPIAHWQSNPVWDPPSFPWSDLLNQMCSIL